MASNISWITVWNPERTRFTTSVISREKANAMLRILDGLEEPQNKQQANYLLRVKKISPSLDKQRRGDLSPDKYSDDYWAKLDAKTAQTGQKTVTDTTHLTHEGIEQGAYQGLPVNDR